MRKIVSVLSAAVLTLTLCACSSGSSTSSITVAGSTTCLPIAEIAAEGFKEETGIDVLVSGLGSSAGIEAVSAGTADPRRSLIPTQVKTLQGQTLYVGYDQDGASVNQSVAACKGVKTRNGTVWLIDSVLLPQFK